MIKSIPLILCLFSSLTIASANEELNLLYKQEKYSEVVKQLKPKSFDDFELLVQSQLALDIDDAEDAVILMVDSIPDNYRAHMLYSSVMGALASNGIFGALGYAKKAKTGLLKAVELAPDSTEAIDGLISFYLAAPSIAGGDKDEALRLVDSIKELDAIAGQFAMVRYLMSTGKEESVEPILQPLLENNETKVRALYILAQFYHQADDIDKAVSHYKAVIDLESNKASSSAEGAKQLILLSKYNIGRIAIDTPSYSADGVTTLKAYIEEYLETTEKVYGMPNLSWARLRLIELMINTGMVDEARALVPTISDNKPSRFKKTRKQLLKRLKKA